MVFIDVIESFCEELGIDSAAVLGKSKSLELWNARYMLWHYMHYYMGFSATKISRIFDRNRPSIFRGIRLIKHQMKYDSKMRETYYGICAKIEGADSSAPSGDI